MPDDMDVLFARPHLFLGSRLKRLGEQMQADARVVSHQAGIAIPPGQYPLLVTLDEMGPKTIGGLAHVMGISQPAITQSASKLAKAGLVSVERTSADKRQSIVALTPEGEKLLDRAKRAVWPLLERAVQDLVAGLSGGFLDQIAVLEKRLLDGSLSARVLASTKIGLELASDADVPLVLPDEPCLSRPRS